MKPSVPDRTAVLVIDVQTGLFGANPTPSEAEAVIARINEVTARARQAGAPVIRPRHLKLQPRRPW